MNAICLAAGAHEFDFGKVVFVIVFLLVGFFQWLANLWKQKRADAMRTGQFRRPESESRQSEADTAWDKHAETPPAGAPVEINPLEELLKTFREIAAPTPAPPPLPLRLPAAPATVAPKAPPARAKVMAETVLPPAVPVPVVKYRRVPASDRWIKAGELKRAVILSEILGAPKALQSTKEHLI